MAARVCLLVMAVMLRGTAGFAADDPPTIDPFGRQSAIRDDAVPGYIELSDGTLLPGSIHLTRDTRLKIHDAQQQRQREVPWEKIQQIECEVTKEWLQDEWRFRENASDQKVFTGNRYPARIYVHTITVSNGESIRGVLSGVLYLQQAGQPTRKFELHKRAKGKVGEDLESLVFVRRIRLGQEALEEAEKRLAEQETRRLQKPPKDL